MKKSSLLTLLVCCITSYSYAQNGVSSINHSTQMPEPNSFSYVAAQEILKTAKRSPLPAGQTEKPLTIRASTGKGINTQACGVVTELTLLHRSHEPAMMSLVIQAINTGKSVLIKDVKCLGSGKAVGSSASLMSETQSPINPSDRCKLPLAKGRMQGC